MTVLVARQDPGGPLYVGADRLVVGNGGAIVAPKRKLFEVGGAVFGTTGDSAVGQRFARRLRKRAPTFSDERDLEVVLEVLDELKIADGWDWILATRFGLFELTADGSLERARPWGAAGGQGGDAARAILYDRRAERGAFELVCRALEVACELFTGCGCGFDVYRVGDGTPELVVDAGRIVYRVDGGGPTAGRPADAELERVVAEAGPAAAEIA